MSDIKHIKGKENVVADTLSRGPPLSQPSDVPPLPLAAVVAANCTLPTHKGIDFAAIAKHQQTCTAVQLMVTSSSLKVR
jgi:hypothetical protein